MFVKLFTTQLNKLVSKRLCINSVCDDQILHYPPWPCLPVIVSTYGRNPEISPLCSGSSNSSPWFLTNDGIRKNVWVFFFSLFLQQPTTMQTTISTSVRAGFDYVWGTPTGRMATVVKRRVTWVKTKNRGFTVTLQCLSIQVSPVIKLRVASLEYVTRINKVVQFSSVQWLKGKHFSVGLSPHPLLIP